MRLKFDPGIFCRFFLRWMLITMALATLNSVQAAPFTNNSDGTTTDSATGLTWMRCSMGQTWNGSTCLGTAATYTFAQANALTGTTIFANQSDWRLPNIRELQTIVDRSTYNPAINSTVFPNTQSALYWSDSPFLLYSNTAWVVYFGTDGVAHYQDRPNSYAVRLVRGGQSAGGLLSITRPSSDYVNNGNGTVTHTPTNLMWKRCAEGMIWTGSTCSGTASSFTASQAEAVSSNFAGHSDWRLPTEDELVSLVDYSLLNPAMNTSIFPATPAAPNLYFWSASLYAKLSSSSWIVGFYDGLAQGNNSRNYGYPVRLVRTPSCTYALSSSSTSVSYSGGSGNVTVTSSSPSCTVLAASSNASWITITSSGNGSVGYSVAANTSNTARTGALTIAGQTFTVTQDAPLPICSGYTLSPNSGSMVSGGGTGSVTVTPSNSSCSGWAASSNASWITITSSGNGSVGYSVVANTSNTARTGALTIAGQTFMVTQAGTSGGGSLACSSGSQTTVQKFYLGYYNRCADQSGMAYWCTRLDQTGGVVGASSLIAAFGTSQEFKDNFSWMTDSQLITALYQNMYSRGTDSAGLSFYLNLLNQRRQEWINSHNGSSAGATEYALSRIALDILNGTTGSDVTTLNSKVSSCPTF